MSPPRAACSAGPAPRNGTCTIFKPVSCRNQAHGEVRALPDAGRAIGQLVRIGLDVGDQLGDRLDPVRRMRRDDVRNPDQVADRLQLVRLVVHVAEDAVGDRVGAGIADQDGVPVALLAHDFRRADGAAAAGAVFDDRGLAPCRLQMRRQQPSHHVGGAARRRPARSGGRFRSAASRRRGSRAAEWRPQRLLRPRSARGGEKLLGHIVTPCLVFYLQGQRRECAWGRQAGGLATGAG